MAWQPSGNVPLNKGNLQSKETENRRDRWSTRRKMCVKSAQIKSLWESAALTVDRALKADPDYGAKVLGGCQRKDVAENVQKYLWEVTEWLMHSESNAPASNQPTTDGTVDWHSHCPIHHRWIRTATLEDCQWPKDCCIF